MPSLSPRQAEEESQRIREGGIRRWRTIGQVKNIIAVAVAHVTQCPYCIRGHTRAALRDGVSQQELMEAIWVGAEMRAGAAFAHSIIAIDEMDKVEPAETNDHPAPTPALEEHHDH